MTEAIKSFRETLRDTIKKLRASLPAVLPLAEYCRVTGRCHASAYNDLRNKPGLGVKIGRRTFFVRDVMLDEMENPPLWVPQRDRAPKAKVVARKRPTRPRRDKQTAAPRREPDPEVRP